MKRFQADRLSIDAYQMIDAPVADPEETEVRIKIAACGVGYVDALVAAGGYQVKPPTPFTPGAEISGRIDAVGSGVQGLAIGDRVMVMTAGGFAEYAVASARKVIKIPDKVSFEQAACLPMNYLTALHGLKDRGQLKPGERLLVMGAAGGVGLAAVQIGRIMGAKVIAVASTEAKRAFALAHGAQAVVDTERDGWRDRLKIACDGKGVDVVFDPVCGPLFELAFRSLAWEGRHLVVGFIGGMPALPVNLALMKGAALIGVDIRQFNIFQPALAARHLEQLASWTEDILQPVVGRVFDFSEAPAAMEFALGGAAFGKTILKIS